MKRFSLIFIILFSASILCGDLAAQESEGLFGGRFLRRLRNRPSQKDNDSKKSDKKSDSKKKSSSDKKKSSPTPAKKDSKNESSRKSSTRSNREPTPAFSRNTSSRSKSTNTPTPALTAPRSEEIGTGAVRLSGENQRDEAKEQFASPQKPATESSKKSTLGFGMLIKMKKDELVVSKLDSKGNAKEAGVKNGDVIKSIGGVKVESMNEYNEIAEILTKGDQIEIELERRGKEEKLLVQLGDAPKPDPNATEASEEVSGKLELNLPTSDSSRPGNLTLQSSSRQSQNDANQSVMKSVLNSTQNNLANPGQQGTLSKDDLIRQQQLEIEAMRRQLETLRQRYPQANSQNSVVPTITGPRK